MGGVGGKAPKIMMLSWQLAASIHFSPFTKNPTRPSFAEAYLSHEDPPKPLCWPTVSGSRWRVVAVPHYGSARQCSSVRSANTLPRRSAPQRYMSANSGAVMVRDCRCGAGAVERRSAGRAAHPSVPLPFP